MYVRFGLLDLSLYHNDQLAYQSSGKVSSALLRFPTGEGVLGSTFAEYVPLAS